jgi:hypothetical protein
MHADPDHAVLMRLAQPPAKPKFELRFSLHRLFFSTAAIAIGLAMIVWGYDTRSGYAFAFCWFGCGPMIGMGVMNLHGRPILGAILGFALQVILILAAIGWGFTHPPNC